MNVMKIIVSIFLFLLTAQVASAEVVITEIMYDLEGSDSGREWIEVQNTGSEDIDISTWRFREAEVNHKLNVAQGSGVIPAGGYAIIADNTDKFLVDHSFSGVLFDSSFSLKNTGEELTIKDADLVDIDTVAYDPEIGAKGDGNSLQLSGGVWVVGSPTPGSGASSGGGAEQATEESEVEPSRDAEEESSLPSSSSNVSGWPTEPQVLVNAGERMRIAVVGADTEFTGRALGIEKDPLLGIRYLWVFGDGGSREGERVLYHYSYPGEYVVMLRASSGKYVGTDRVRVMVIPADITISSVGFGVPSFVELYNQTPYELDLSRWVIKVDESMFSIPRDTIILSGNKIRFSSETTELFAQSDDTISLLYSNGITADTYNRFDRKPIAFSAQQAISPPSVVALPPRNTPPPIIDTPTFVAEDTKFPTTTTKEQQVANVLFTAEASSSSSLKWIFGVGVLALISIVALILGRREKTEAERYTILEE